MKYQTYEKIKTLPDLKKRIQKEPEKILPVAGATDIMVKARNRDWYQNMNLVDITEIPELKGIREEKDFIIIGALVTADEILQSEAVSKYAGILAESCKMLAGPQIRNRATIGGNLANACLAGDMIPALCVLGAQVETIVGKEERSILAEQLLKKCPACLNHEEMSVGSCFFGIPAGKKTVLMAGEIIIQVRIPKMSSGYRIAFQKVGRKQSGCMSRFTLAAAMDVEDTVIRDLRISIGAAFADITLLKESETLIGETGSEELFSKIAQQIGNQIETQMKKPNDSVKYKAEVCRRLMARTLMELYQGRNEEEYG
mgnify:CR=1 FL=1